LAQTNDQKEHDFAQKMLDFSINSHFLPAILMAIEFNAKQSGNSDTLIDLLGIAAMKYEFPPAMFQLGMILLNNEQTAVNGFNMLQQAAQRGFGLAVVAMGNALSPLSSIKFPAKDATQALMLFEQVIKEADEPNALYEAAKLYDAGLGCKADHTKAVEYLNRARKADPNIPELPKHVVKAEVKETLKTLAIAASSCAAIAGLGYAVYKIFAKKKK